MNKRKITEVLSGQNTLNAIIIIVLLILKANGVIDNDQDINTLAQSLAANWEWIFTFSILPVVKIIKNIIKGEFNWSFVKNTNFITVILSLLSLFLIPLIGEDNYAILIMILTQFLNSGYQLSLPVKNK